MSGLLHFLHRQAVNQVCCSFPSAVCLFIAFEQQVCLEDWETDLESLHHSLVAATVRAASGDWGWSSGEKRGFTERRVPPVVA